MEMEMEEEQREEKMVKVVGLIEKATNSTRPEVDPRLLKAIKSLVRFSDSELRSAAQTLLSFMKRDHSQIRYLSLLIIDELFMRSKLFRTLIVDNLDQLLSLSIGFRRNLPLPAPAAVASQLRSKAIEFLEKWNVSFGIHYRQLRLGYDYLKNILRYQFPNLQANAARIQQERRERELKTREILLKKFEFLKTNLDAIKEEIGSTVDEIGECLDLITNKDGNMPVPLMDDEEMEEFRNSELREIRLDSLKEGERVPENSENKVIFDALRELYKVLVTKHLASVQEYISVLIRAEVSDTRSRDSMLKEFIDIKNHLISVRKRCEEAGCVLTGNTGSEEDIIWEEGTLESFKTDENSIMRHHQTDFATTSSSNKAKNEAPESSNKRSSKQEKQDHAGIPSESNPLRNKLLTEAPAVKWGSFLDYWGSNRDILANQRGFDLDNHWGRVDTDAVIPAEKIAELNVQATVYNEEPVEIQPCRAPLRKGGLCQRKDLKACPFHGLIVPRDDEGKPIINQSSSDEEMAPTISSHLTEQLAREAVQNIREKDKEEGKKRENDRHAIKRAKLAKILGHNEAVLRDAALASTSRSSYVGGELEETNHARSSSRNKSETLASMLKKKETSKGRLSKRLLNARASDASTRQLTMGEDANYRESFPNQW